MQFGTSDRNPLYRLDRTSSGDQLLRKGNDGYNHLNFGPPARPPKPKDLKGKLLFKCTN